MKPVIPLFCLLALVACGNSKSPDSPSAADSSSGSTSQGGGAGAAKGGASGSGTDSGGTGIATGGGSGDPAIDSVAGAHSVGGTNSVAGAHSVGGTNSVAGAHSVGGTDSAGGAANQGGATGSTDPGIRWLGRVEKTQTGARFAWPGTGFMVRFQGTGLTANLKTDENDYFQVVVDGKVTLVSTKAGTRAYDLARNLAAGEHVATFWRRTETVNGVVEVVSVDVVGGMLLSPPAIPNRRIEVVGDSITVGFGVECSANDSFTFANENNYLTYEAIAARALGADLVTLAWTGIGMLRDDDGQTKEQMPERYLRTIASDSASKWSFNGSIPDAVVVALGTNDFATGDPGQGFVTAYTKFLDDLRGRYPKARLYLAGSPLIGDDSLVKYLTQLKNARNTKGDTNVAVIEFQPPAGDGWGCGHPNGATHQIMAAKLQQTLKTDLGW